MSRQPVLYDYWRSSASYRVRIALGLKRIDYESVPVDLTTGAQSAPEHLERNPQGYVPALKIDGLLLTQSVAIIAYLDETRPAPALLPSTAPERARVRALCDLIAMDIHPICNLNVAVHVEALTGTGPEARPNWMQHFIQRGLDAFESLLDAPDTGRFCHGDSPGVADCCLIPQLYNAHRWKVPLAPFPRIRQVEAQCNLVDAFAAAQPRE